MLLVLLVVLNEEDFIKIIFIIKKPKVWKVLSFEYFLSLKIGATKKNKIKLGTNFKRIWWTKTFEKK
jgi:hypothetical protein